MCKVNDKVGWAPPSYLKTVEKGESGESDSDDDYLGLPGGEPVTLHWLVGSNILHWASISHTSTLWSLWPYVHFLSVCVCVCVLCVYQ